MEKNMRERPATNARDSASPPAPPASASSSDSVITWRAMRTGTGAERDADREFLPARRGLRAQQSAEVHAADDQQQDGDGAQRRHQARLLVVFRHPARLADGDAAVLADGSAPPRLRHDGRELRCGIGQGASWRESSDHAEGGAVGCERILAPAVADAQHH
jgi:hypothetical protein